MGVVGRKGKWCGSGGEWQKRGVVRGNISARNVGEEEAKILRRRMYVKKNMRI